MKENGRLEFEGADAEMSGLERRMLKLLTHAAWVVGVLLMARRPLEKERPKLRDVKAAANGCCDWIM